MCFGNISSLCWCRFEPLAKLDEAQGEVKGEEEGEEGEEGEAEEEYYDEEVEEEDTDYNLSYFDNGEDYGGDEDDHQASCDKN